MKRYCQTLQLRDDAVLIEKYIEVHSHVWPEVIKGQHAVGILQKWQLMGKIFDSEA